MAGLLVVVFILAISGFTEGAQKTTSSADKPTASKDTIELVEYFIKIPTANLPPEAVPDFMKVDPKTLPAKLQGPCKAKQIEIAALKKIADGSNKPPIRRFDMDAPKCGDPVKGEDMLVNYWKLAKYVEATKEEVAMAEEETKCSECELETEFTLMRMQWEDTGGKKGKKEKKGNTKIRYFFHSLDPVWMLIDMYKRNQRATTGTAFFGTGGTVRCH